MSKTYPKVTSVINKLSANGWNVRPTDNSSILVADKDGVLNKIFLYRNGGDAFSKVAVIEVRGPGANCRMFADSIAQAIRLAGPAVVS